MLLILSQLALVLAVSALLATGLRAASLASPGGSSRIIAAMVIATSLAVVQALLLGLVGLGTDPSSLLAASAVTWLVALRWLPTPQRALSDEVTRQWRGLSAFEQAALGALAGTALAWVAWLWKNPALGIDSISYHVPQIAAWVQNGRPGSIETLSYLWAIGNYPLTNEVVLSWAVGLSGSFAPLAPWMIALLALLGFACWSVLRALGVARRSAALGVAALITLPLVVQQVSGPNTDLPALTWLVCAGCLALHSLERPALLPPAVLAVGLSVGTKTTTAVLAVTLIAVAGVANRRQLRPLQGALALAISGAVIVGGFWYLRNLVTHGSPLWPFVALPGGDPVPELWSRISVSLLERPVFTLSGRVEEYLALLGGGVAMLGASVVAPLLARNRTVAVVAAVTIVSLFLWAGSPTTGAVDRSVLGGNALTTTRYLLPTLASATLVLALATRGGWKAWVAGLVGLTSALIVNLAADAALLGTKLPSATTYLLGAGLGAVTAVAITWSVQLRVSRRATPQPNPRSNGRRWRVVLAAVGIVAISVSLADAATGWLQRHSTAGVFYKGYQGVVSWIAGRPDFKSGDHPIALAPTLLGPLAGDSLNHRLELVPAAEPCSRLARRLSRQWVVVNDNRVLGSIHPFTASGCLRDRPATWVGRGYRVYAPRRQPSADATH